MTPWELVKRSEHSHQRALFAWANCAALYGFDGANEPLFYAKEERDAFIAKHKPNLEPRPELHRLFAVHNQGHGDKIRGAQAKAEGVKAGVPDIMLPVSRLKADHLSRAFHDQSLHGLFIELKRPRHLGTSKGQLSVEQAEWMKWLGAHNYHCAVCWGWEEAAHVIQDYLR